MRPDVQVRLVGPSEEPVTLDEARNQLRIGHCEDDAYLSLLIQAAREYAEEATHRAFIEQVWVAQYRRWPRLCIHELNTQGTYWIHDRHQETFELTRPPFMGLEKVEYYDVSDVLTLVPESNLIVETLAFPAEIGLKSTFSHPVLSKDRPYPVQITFRAGFGAAQDVPAKVKMAILLMVSHLYVNRVPVISGTIVAKFPLSVDALLASISRRNA